MTQFLIFATNAGNGRIEYHIRKIDSPKPHQLQQAVNHTAYNTYEDARKVKENIKTPPSFRKPY